MSRLLVLLSVALFPALALLPPGSSHALQAAGLEPSLRCRVTIGGESHELVLGERLVPRPGAPEILVELLPARAFRLPGAFTFDYPREWRFGCGLGGPDPADAWWTLGGESTSYYLRRHAGDPLVIRDEYATNCERTGATDRRALALEFGGRSLEGISVRLSIGSFQGAPARDSVQEIFAWRSGEHAYLFVIQRTLAPAASTGLPGLLPELTSPDWTAPPSAEAQETGRALELLRQSFRWE